MSLRRSYCKKELVFPGEGWFKASVCSIEVSSVCSKFWGTLSRVIDEQEQKKKLYSTYMIISFLNESITSHGSYSNKHVTNRLMLPDHDSTTL